VIETRNFNEVTGFMDFDASTERLQAAFVATKNIASANSNALGMLLITDQFRSQTSGDDLGSLN
jgi:hypothetical protein